MHLSLASLFGPPLYLFWLVLLWIGYLTLGYFVMLKAPSGSGKQKDAEQNHLAESKDGQE